ncbi:hypothetical protein, partial [Nocardioides sp.]|uniref:hypothetical protein n=1 Tax=Nocardioides sp. TaxID=35761 RepID=UPI002733016D
AAALAPERAGGASTGGPTGHSPDDGHGHDHADPATKNALSRGGEVSEDAVDTTSAREARANTAYVAKDRRAPAPQLRKKSFTRPRLAVPQDRYAMASGCYTLQAPNGRYVQRSGTGLAATAGSRAAAEGFHFRATDLGTYLLYGRQGDFLSGASGRVTMAAKPARTTEWTAQRSGKRFTFRLPGGAGLAVSAGTLTTGSPTAFALRNAGGCRSYPEVQVNVEGLPHGGTTSFQEVRGYVDPHTHGMAFEFLGGRVHCGKPWHPYGAAYALVDCPDHHLTAGHGAVLESVLSGETSHDPVGWPTFKDWPAPNSLTHEGTYYKWMERSWRGGLRIFTNLLVENGQLCKIYPLKKNSCDDMTSIRLQAKRMREFERYVDAQYGGPGRGWYRIVTSPWQARKVINQGKLAIVMGIETSVPFGCTFKALPVLGDQPACDVASIDRQLDEMHRLGVRQMELVNKFDNALAGVAGDAGEVGVAVNGANFLETGSFWAMEHCEPADGESADKPQLAVPDISAGQQDALFGAVASLGLNLPGLPLYPPPAHCNRRGLTDLGAHLIDKMMAKKWLIDPDHMSVKARQATLTQLERAKYPGVVSSHSWSTPDAYPRIYRLGGFVAPYAGDSQGFYAKWKRHLGWADSRYFFGFGYGADMNGLGAQGDPRGANVPNKVTYPFTGINGITIGRQVSGKRVYDINVDGVSHYGLYPDWIEDLRRIGGRADGADIVTDMARGPEAYLQTWERAEGLKPDSCRNPGLRRKVPAFQRALRRGMTTHQVMRKVGQPYSRVGKRFTYCAKTSAKKKVTMKVTFKRNGTLRKVTRRG